MIAREASLKDMIESEPHQLEIPFFQCRYVWKEENWEEKRQFGNIEKSHLDFLLYSAACIKWTDETLKNIHEEPERVFEQKAADLGADELEGLSNPYMRKRLYENISKYSIEDKEVVCDLENIAMNREVKLLGVYLVRRKIYSASTSGYSKKCMEALGKGIGQLYSDFKLEGENSDVLEADKRLKEALKNIR